jgi:hypothetical protein
MSNNYNGLLRLLQQEIKALPLKTQKIKASGPINVTAVLAMVVLNGINYS